MKIAVFSNYCGSEQGARHNVNYNQVGTYPHFFFTNNGVVGHNIQRAGWTLRLLPYLLSDNAEISCMQAKEQKIRPHLVSELMEFDFLVFRDAKMTGLDFTKLPEIIQKMQERDMHSAFPVHPRNVVAEACESMFQPRYANQRHLISNYIVQELDAGGRARMP